MMRLASSHRRRRCRSPNDNVNTDVEADITIQNEKQLTVRPFDQPLMGIANPMFPDNLFPVTVAGP